MIRRLAAALFCLVAFGALALPNRPGFRPGLSFFSGIPAFVPAAFQSANMYTDWTQPNSDGTYGKTWLALSNTTVNANTVWSRTGSGGTAFDISGNVVSFSGTALRATSAGLTTEEARTNLFLNTATPATQTITVTNGSTYTVSCQGTGTLTLSGAITGTAACGHPGTPKTAATTTTSLTVTVSGTVTWPQVELGGFATTPIAVVGTPVTRAADIITATNTTWLTQSPATITAAASFTYPYATGQYGRVFSLDDGTPNNRIGFGASSTQALQGFTVIGGTATLTAGPPFTANTLYKEAYSYGANSQTYYVNGSSGGTSTAATNPTVSAARLGFTATPTEWITGVITTNSFFPSVLSAAQLQAVTQ